MIATFKIELKRKQITKKEMKGTKVTQEKSKKNLSFENNLKGNQNTMITTFYRDLKRT